MLEDWWHRGIRSWGCLSGTRERGGGEVRNRNYRQRTNNFKLSRNSTYKIFEQGLSCTQSLIVAYRCPYSSTHYRYCHSLFPCANINRSTSTSKCVTEFPYRKSASSEKETSPFSGTPGCLSLLWGSDVFFTAQEVVPANTSMVWHREGWPGPTPSSHPETLRACCPRSEQEDLPARCMGEMCFCSGSQRVGETLFAHGIFKKTRKQQAWISQEVFSSKHTSRKKWLSCLSMDINSGCQRITQLGWLNTQCSSTLHGGDSLEENWTYIFRPGCLCWGCS